MGIDNDIKNSALGRYLENEIKKNKPKTKRRKNKSPEKTVVKELLKWLKDNGFSADVIEASSYDRVNKIRVHDTKVVAGFTDIVATDMYGFACYIEAKAPKRRSQLKEHQREFIINKINNNAFACVTDSIEHLSHLYNQWILLKLKKTEYAVLKPLTPAQVTGQSPKKLLLLDLPKTRLAQPLPLDF